MSLFDGFGRGKVAIDGIEIAYVVGGSGPPLLLLHGFPQTMALWARVAPRLAERFTVVAADLRGYGDSAKPRCRPDNANYSFRAMAGDMVGLMRHLGFERFHVAGHDRGGRAAHRMALDHPDAVQTLAVIDIAPTWAMLMETNRKIAGAYWHWYFLSQPEPFPERMIGYNPDFFFEQCLFGWGAASAADFDPEMLAAYRVAWRDPAAIHGACADYRAAATIDLDHDTADLDRMVDCPTLVFFGAKGVMAKLMDLEKEWRRRVTDVRVASLPGGHFFIDRFPQETAAILGDFLAKHA
jgi:haloacetate dehalogenase